MKKLLMAVVALMTTLSVNAQSAGDMFIKPMVGGTLSTITKADDAKMRLGLVGGAEFGYHINDPFYVTGGLLVAMQGTNYKDDTYQKDMSNTATYLNIPILANYNIIPGLAIKAGIQAGIPISSKTTGTINLMGTWEDFEHTGTSDMTKPYFSIPVGLSYEISDFVIDARYHFGLSKVMKESDNKFSVIMLTVGYKIHL